MALGAAVGRCPVRRQAALKASAGAGRVETYVPRSYRGRALRFSPWRPRLPMGVLTSHFYSGIVLPMVIVPMVEGRSIEIEAG